MTIREPPGSQLRQQRSHFRFRQTCTANLQVCTRTLTESNHGINNVNCHRPERMLTFICHFSAAFQNAKAKERPWKKEIRHLTSNPTIAYTVRVESEAMPVSVKEAGHDTQRERIKGIFSSATVSIP